jgi:hypothetical protein
MGVSHTNMYFHFNKNDVYFTYILIGSDFCQYIQTETSYYFYQTLNER